MKRAAKWLGGIVLVLLLIAGGLVWVADTGVGHRLIADRIAGLTPKNGLRIRIGRIDGSIYGHTRLTRLQLADPRGVFFEADSVVLDWTPAAWLRNKLDIDVLTAPAATLHRLPKLIPSDKPSPILPDFDIHVGRFAIDKLVLGEGIAKPARTGRVAGRGDVHDGRALIDLDAAVQGGDAVVLKLDSQPDRDRFDVDATVTAPRGGAIVAMLGIDRPLALRIDGDGRYSDWHGTLVAQSGTNELANMTLGARGGRYDFAGVVRPALLIDGPKVAALAGPQVKIIGNARLDQRRLDTHVALASPALAIGANGIVDLSDSSFERMRVDVRVLNPAALQPTLRARDLQALLLLDGPFATATFDYRITTPRAQFGETGFDDVRVTGRGRLSASPPQLVPVKFTARRVTGVGTVAGGILNNLSVEGVLRVTTKLIVGDGLRLRSDKLNSTISVVIDLTNGLYNIGANGQLSRFFIEGLGIVDVKSTLNVVPGPGGQGVRVVGRAQVWVRRFDNAFLAGLTNGLPYVESALERTPDGLIRFTNARLRSPGLTLVGNGYRRLDGTFFFEGSGRQAKYGPVRLRLDGPIERPKVDLILASPFESAGLRDVRASLVPNANGFTWRAAGGSLLGAFNGSGAILLPKGGITVIRVDELRAGGVNASGSLRVIGGGLDGTLAVAGGGLDGTVALATVRGIQRVETHLNARDVKFVGPPLLVVGRGRLDLVALLDPRGTSVDATFTGQGLRYEDIALARLSATARLRGGVGEVRAAFAGSRGRGFDLQTLAQVTPNRIVVQAQGTVDRRPIRLEAPAVLTREGGGWRLQPARVAFSGGNATVGGRFGGGTTELAASIERMPLTVLDIVSPDLGLGGIASGRINFAERAGGAPTGSAMIRVRNLSRAGITVISKPVDAGVNAILNEGGLVFRAVAASGGQTVGQAQGRIAPLGGGSLTSRLRLAPVFAQLRYNGPADTLWRLTGVETFDLSGPLAVAADVTGSVAQPAIRGSIRTDNLRIESPVSGTVITGLKAIGRFDRSKLIIDSFAGTAGRGTIAGRATFDLASASGFGIDIQANAREATVIQRDDFAATVTGPLRIVADGPDGRISGDVVLDRGAFRLGQASAVTQVPTLKVREINRPAGSPRIRAAPTFWALDIKARADSRLAVTGLGLDSEWRADLDVGGSLDAPRILGRADLVRGGYEFAGKRFDLQRGSIRFQGSWPPDPTLDIVANANIQSISATISVTGTGQRPQIAFASTPQLPQDELLSRLLFGTSITNLSAPEALQLASAVASLRGGTGLDPINAVRRAIGLDRLRIVPADLTNGNKTAVAAGKYITRRTYVEVISDGQGYSATRVEFAITRWLSLLSTISTIGRQGASVRVSKDY